MRHSPLPRGPLGFGVAASERWGSAGRGQPAWGHPPSPGRNTDEGEGSSELEEGTEGEEEEDHIDSLAWAVAEGEERAATPSPMARLCPDLIHLVLGHLVGRTLHGPRRGPEGPTFRLLVTLSRLNRHWRRACWGRVLGQPWLPSMERVIAYLRDAPSHEGLRVLDLSGVRLTEPPFPAHGTSRADSSCELSEGEAMAEGLQEDQQKVEADDDDERVGAPLYAKVAARAIPAADPGSRAARCRSTCSPPLSPSAWVLARLPMVLRHVSHLSLWLDCQHYSTLLHLLQVPADLHSLHLKGNISNSSGCHLFAPGSPVRTSSSPWARAREAQHLLHALSIRLAPLAHLCLDVGFEGDPGRVKLADFLVPYLSPALTALRITGLPDRLVERVAHACPRVQCFVHPWSSLSEGVVMSALASWTQLRTLDLRGCQSAVTEASIQALCRACRHLTALDMSFTQGGDAVLDALARHASALEALILAGCQELSEAGLLHLLARRGHQLAVLSLAWLGEGVVTPGLLADLAQRAPHLRRLDVRGAQCLARPTLDTLRQGCRMLEVLRMDAGGMDGGTTRAPPLAGTTEGDVKGSLFEV